MENLSKFTEWLDENKHIIVALLGIVIIWMNDYDVVEDKWFNLINGVYSVIALNAGVSGINKKIRENKLRKEIESTLPPKID